MKEETTRRAVTLYPTQHKVELKREYASLPVPPEAQLEDLRISCSSSDKEQAASVTDGMVYAPDDEYEEITFTNREELQNAISILQDRMAQYNILCTKTPPSQMKNCSTIDLSRP